MWSVSVVPPPVDRLGQVIVVGGVLVFQPGEQAAEPLAVLGVEAVVGVEPEDPLARGVTQRLVAGGGEIIDPGEVEDLGAEARGDGPGAVGRAGVDDDHFVDEIFDPRKAGSRFAASFLTIIVNETRERLIGG